MAVPVAITVLALAAAWAAALAFTLAAMLVPALPRPPASFDGPVEAGSFLAVAVPTSAGLLAVAAFLLAFYPARVPWTVRREDLRATLGATLLLVGLNVLGSLALNASGQAYHGVPVASGPLSALAVTLAAAGLAPLVEELFFREALLARVFRDRPGLGTAVTSLAFGALHAALGGWILILTLSLMGAVLARLRLRTGSLGAPIVAHALQNALALAGALAGPPPGLGGP